jgi:hypothetical protein
VVYIAVSLIAQCKILSASCPVLGQVPVPGPVLDLGSGPGSGSWSGSSIGVGTPG